MKKRRHRILIVLALTVVVGVLVAWLFRHRPIARLTLPDGTELRLEYVTYGTEHRVPGAGRFGEWLSQKAQRWPGLGVRVYRAEYRYTFETPTLLLWFTHFDPKTGQLVPAPGVEVHALEGHSFFADQGMYVNSPPMPHATCIGFVYERRQPEIRLRFGESNLGAGQPNPTAIVTIPNPAAKTTFPTWHPEPLPQTRRIGEVEAVLRAVKASRYKDTSEIEITPQFEALYHGGDTPGISWGDWEIMDVTGNLGTEYRPPPLEEPVWKLRKPFTRTQDFPFSATDGRLLGPVRMPEPGKCAVLPLSERDIKWGFQFVVVLGPGYYRWEKGVLVDARVPRPEGKEWWASSGEPVKKDTRIVYCSAPSVFFAYSEGQGFDFEGGNPFEDGRVVRVYSDNDAYGLSEDTRFAGLSGFEIGDNAVRGACYALTRSDKPELSDANPAKSLPAGTELWIQVVPVKMEYLEFLIVPPKPTVEPRRSEEEPRRLEIR